MPKRTKKRRPYSDFDPANIELLEYHLQLRAGEKPPRLRPSTAALREQMDAAFEGWLKSQQVYLERLQEKLSKGMQALESLMRRAVLGENKFTLTQVHRALKINRNDVFKARNSGDLVAQRDEDGTWVVTIDAVKDWFPKYLLARKRRRDLRIPHCMPKPRGSEIAPPEAKREQESVPLAPTRRRRQGPLAS